MSYPSKVSLISRGHLFGWCKQFGASLWPSELDDVRSLLELFLSNPQEVLHTKLLSKLLQKILAIENHKAKLSSSAKFYRAVTSAALLTGIATSGYAEAKNHFAIVSAWILFAVTTIAAGEKHGYKLDRAAAESFKLAEQAIADALSELWNEVSSRKHLIQGASLPDPEIYGWRYVTLLGLLSCLAILDDSRPCLLEDARTKLQNWLTQPLTRIDLWGEGVVAALVPWLVWLRKHDATIRPDREIHGLAKAVITRNQRNSESPLANPYYNFEEILRFKLHLDKAGEASSVGRETFVGSSFTAEPLLHLLVRTNLKQACKMLWPEFTKISHRMCVPNNRWEYGTLHIASGWDETKIYPSTYKWSDLKTEAIHRRNHKIPTELAARPWLLGLWWQVAPHRYTTPSNRVFVESVLPGWGG